MTAGTEKSIQKILVVDDNAQNRAVAEGHLVAEGYAVALASGGEEAIATFEEQTPDLVLLDVLMPGIDGFETCRRLRGVRGGTEIPIVFLTALADLGSHRQALDSGADDFLTKPINRTELLLRVRSLLWIKRLRDDLRQGYNLIRSQRDALVHAQRQREELTALLIHDLKNPLAAIEMTAKFLASSQNVSASAREASCEIVDAAAATRRMVMNLLDICRSEDGALVPKWSDVDIEKLLDEVVRENARQAAYREIQITGQSQVEPRFLADVDLLRRVLENLIVNAIRHSPRKATVEVSVVSADGTIEFRVRDTGPGVPEALREKIFEKYVTIDSGHTDSTNRGLGLTFCRLAAEVHGGRIWVESNQPEGSVFVVSIPWRASGPMSVASASASSSS
jgi:two-component system, sensor histidine kinase and response regulator